MDPLTQGAAGAAVALATRRREQAAVAAGCGFLAGMAPDLDVLIRDPDDTLLFLEFHRQFTHALIFIPIGGALVAGLLFGFARRWLGLGFLKVWLFCALGYGTHGLLDAATSYGTLLLWPFDDTRVAFSIIPIIDPLFSLPVLAMVGAGAFRRDGRWGRWALVWAGLYLAAGAWQHNAALTEARNIAQGRGHVPDRMTVKPTFANIILWRSVYETDGRFYVDAVRPGPWAKTFSGASVAKFDARRDFPWLSRETQQYRDIDRFRRFSQDYLARATDGSPRIIDVRYGFLPTEVSELWSIRLDRAASPHAHAVYETDRSRAREHLPRLIRMVFAAP